MVERRELIYDEKVQNFFNPEKTMKCFAFKEFGEPENVLNFYDDRLIPVLNEYDVLIQVFATSVNRFDVNVVKGIFFFFFYFFLFYFFYFLF